MLVIVVRWSMDLDVIFLLLERKLAWTFLKTNRCIPTLEATVTTLTFRFEGLLGPIFESSQNGLV